MQKFNCLDLRLVNYNLEGTGDGMLHLVLLSVWTLSVVCIGNTTRRRESRISSF